MMWSCWINQQINNIVVEIRIDDRVFDMVIGMAICREMFWPWKYLYILYWSMNDEVFLYSSEFIGCKYLYYEEWSYFQSDVPACHLMVYVGIFHYLIATITFIVSPPMGRKGGIPLKDHHEKRDNMLHLFSIYFSMRFLTVFSSHHVLSFSYASPTSRTLYIKNPHVYRPLNVFLIGIIFIKVVLSTNIFCWP